MLKILFPGPDPTYAAFGRCVHQNLAIWHLVLEPDAECTLPPAAGPDTLRVLYRFEGSVRIGEHDLEASSGAGLRGDAPVTMTAGAHGAEALVLQGRLTTPTASGSR